MRTLSTDIDMISIAMTGIIPTAYRYDFDSHDGYYSKDGIIVTNRRRDHVLFYSKFLFFLHLLLHSSSI